ncbi:MAG: trypsin-like peptidase domain-containing protein, partial [Nitrosopumilaceae archaeon]
YDKAGHIITNNHVVEGSTTIEVTFNSGNTYFAKSIGTDVSNDIAVLKITDDVPADEIIPLELDDSSDLVVGEPAIAIGNPFGLSNTMTVGIISQTGRLLPNQEGFSIPNVIQTDAAINPGNSGGPLLDLDGKVIGMNTAIQTNTGEFSGIGFAIPSNTIEKIVPILIEKGVYKHPWIGISGMNINSKISDALGLPKNYKGVLVANVIEDSPAEKAGIKEAVYNTKQEIRGGDIIIAIDKTPINRMADIIDYISTKEVGDTVQFTINRDGKTIDLSATLASRPDT